MINGIRQYRKKPIAIEAIRWDGTDDTWRLIEQWVMKDYGVQVYRNTMKNFVRIATLEGNMDAQVGDYIIKGVKDEFYPCKPDIFAATYESAAT